MTSSVWGEAYDKHASQVLGSETVKEIFFMASSIDIRPDCIPLSEAIFQSAKGEEGFYDYASLKEAVDDADSLLAEVKLPKATFVVGICEPGTEDGKQYGLVDFTGIPHLVAA